MGFWEKAGKFAKATGDYLVQKQEEMERTYRSKARSLTDAQLLHATRNAQSDFAKNIAIEEAQRRGLL
ncbi:hypothetical protein RW092_19105 [Paenibacillus sp. 3LSP]|jgi:hypothetical protein|uniref:hypothetical protein n=1 Tax=Paenibacillus TaxID=44249 RepID=UPI0011A987EB|nr:MULTISPECIES: hypothetical protein [Paenibacillus]MDU0332284.1 hypothetical protein [Paenibacillus sp. 3LSP]